MKFKFMPLTAFTPVTIQITCEKLEELQELQVRMSLYKSDLCKVRHNAASKLPDGNSCMSSIGQFRTDLRKVLGPDSLID